MATNPATIADIEARWRPLSAPEQTVAATLLDDAWLILIQRLPSIPERIDNGTLNPELVISVLCAMVLRVLRNPEGKRQESIDDYSYMRDNAVAAGMLYVSDDELGLLDPSGASAVAFTIRPYGEPGYTPHPDPWMPQ